MKLVFKSILKRIREHLDNNSNTMTFENLLTLWKQNHVQFLRLTTQRRYENIIDKSLLFFMTYKVEEIQPTTIDEWIDVLKKKITSSRRHDFKYELMILKNIFNFYIEYSEHKLFQNPIKKRHFKMVKIKTLVKSKKSKNLTSVQFNIFIEHLKRLSNGDTLSNLATLQYFHALRISEVTALCWEDISLNKKSSHQSYMRINKSCKWLSSQDTHVENGFKNSTDLNGIKELPLFPESYDLLINMKTNLQRKKQDIKGLVFKDHNNLPFRYRKIQYYYDKAFKAAKLAYSGTHIMRHGGSRRIYMKNPNIEIAQQLLGNSNAKNTKIYLENINNALSQAIRLEWKKRRA